MAAGGKKASDLGQFHIPVLLQESIEGLAILPEGIYVDATFGGGGHSKEILARLNGGRLVAFDQDEDAVENAAAIQQRSFTFCQANFRYMNRYLKMHSIEGVHGILADLGVSSHQLDIPGRGFSTRSTGPLDMRMDTRMVHDAAYVIATYSEEALHRIFGMYGELRNARTAAKAVVARRNEKPITTTAELIEALKHLAPGGREKKYFAQVFQALRIEVNEEMDALENFLHQCGEMLLSGGRLVVISYHSLEDRMVKRFMQTGNLQGVVKKDFYGNKVTPFIPENKKPIWASEEEIKENSRARSARLRIMTKK